MIAVPRVDALPPPTVHVESAWAAPGRVRGFRDDACRYAGAVDGAGAMAGLPAVLRYVSAVLN